MSNRNNSQGPDAGVALLLGGCAILFLVFYVLAIVVTLFLTMISLLAWRRPLTIAGLTTHPEEAKAFIKGGIVGIWVAVICMNVARLLLGIQIDQEFLPHAFIGGYILGAFGGLWVHEQVKLQQQAEEEARPPQLPSATPQERRELQPFHYASWDDEETRR